MSQPQEAVFKQDLDSTICKNSLANNMASQGSVSKEVQKSCPQVQRELRLVRGIWPPVLHHWSRTICQRQSRISGICPARSACKLAGLPQPKSDSSTNNDSHQRQEPWKERLIYRSRILQGSWQKSKGRVKSRILFRPRAPNLRIFKRAAETVHCPSRRQLFPTRRPDSQRTESPLQKGIGAVGQQATVQVCHPAWSGAASAGRRRPDNCKQRQI